MVLADPPLEIDVTEQRPRPLIPAPHPSPPPKRNTTESHHDSAGQGLFQRPASDDRRNSGGRILLQILQKVRSVIWTYAFHHVGEHEQGLVDPGVEVIARFTRH